MNAKAKRQAAKAPAKRTKAKGPGAVVPAAIVAKTRVPYDRAAINVQTKADREAGKVRLYPNLSKYVKAPSSAPDQRVCLDNGDEVAAALRNVGLTELWAFAEKRLGKDVVKAKKAQYADKNIGMVRMNIGNLIRGKIRHEQRLAALAAAQKQASK